MSDQGGEPDQNCETAPDQTIGMQKGASATTDDRKQSKSNASKRQKPGDDSFEQEHRVANGRNQYFKGNNVASEREPTTTASRPSASGSSTKPIRPTFPPFRITFVADEQTPSELSIIKHVNKHCRIALTYGRYSTRDRRKSFLLYANSSEQFERLMDRTLWPIQICARDYSINFPSKVPATYSVVATGVPAQWAISELEADLRRIHPTIVKVERLFVKGGTPIPKIRVDFSSNTEVAKVLKEKRILLDDEYTAFAVQAYTPPVRVLRCYNCQQYNDHIAASCPHKENPTCFRCGQNHPFNPQCQNKICCANCHQEHMAGNPNCPTKIAERRRAQGAAAAATNKPPQSRPPPRVSAWKTPGSDSDSGFPSTTTTTTTINMQNLANGASLWDLSTKLDRLTDTVERLAVEQAKITSTIKDTNQLVQSLRKEIDTMNEFIAEKVCRFVCNVADAFLENNKKAAQNCLRPLASQFKRDTERHLNKAGHRPPAILPQQTVSSLSPNDESYSADV